MNYLKIENGLYSKKENICGEEIYANNFLLSYPSQQIAVKSQQNNSRAKAIPWEGFCRLGYIYGYIYILLGRIFIMNLAFILLTSFAATATIPFKFLINLI